MPYINRDGTITESEPWGLHKISRMFQGAIDFIILFFKTLVGLDSKSISSGGSRSSGSSFRGSGGGGGGWGGFGSGPKPGGGDGGGRRFMTMNDINPPTISHGGCPGGACGR